MPSALDKRYQTPAFYGLAGRGGASLGRGRNPPTYSSNYLGSHNRDSQPFSHAGSRGGASPHELSALLRRLGDSRRPSLDAELQRERYAQGRRDPGYGHSYGRGHGYESGRGLSSYSRLADELASKERRNAVAETLLAALASKKRGLGSSRYSNHDHEHSHGRGHGCGHANHCDHDNRHGCQAKHNNCSCEHSHCQDHDETDLKTKDVALRGKAYKIRKAFLTDMGKFEHDLIKVVDKRSEEELPDSVIQLLVDFINKESCESRSVVDIVGLSLLGSTLGYTSAIDGSLQQLKEVSARYHIGREDLTKICGMVTMSGKVDEGLKTWLKNLLMSGDALAELFHSQVFQELNRKHPEVWSRLMVIMGLAHTEGALDFPVF